MEPSKIIEFDIACIAKEIKDYENLNIKFSKSNWIYHEADGASSESRHYLYAAYVTLDENNNYKIEDVEAEIEKVKKLYLSTINNEVEFRKMISEEKPTVCFSPANKFTHVNTEAKSLYVFGYVDLKENRLELQFESNFIVL